MQEEVGTFPRPLHLLLLGETPADDEVDGGFGEGDDLAMIPALRIVRDRGDIVPDVGDQLCIPTKSATDSNRKPATVPT